MALIKVEVADEVATVTMNRPEKRNAMSDAFIAELGAVFETPPKGVKAVILTGAGGHYCAGLDLAEHVERSAEEGIYHSRGWHRILDQIQFGGLPVVSAMSGAVIGGGLEIAAATHVRIAEPSTIFQLPEGRRGIFVGGGATVRVGRILGPDRMTEMMLTGRTYGAEEGLRLGLAHYAVGTGEALALARELAAKIACNAPLSNYFMIQALSRIGDMSRADGLFTESLCAALSQTTPDAQEGLRAFLEKRTPRFR
ncbi:enoyl-CoA hydratase [Defluviimonas sp. 20V17]|uniref:Enoyl-CoA hydratase n=1 Tax=Allgaiera indica TaxID=765699 RepID=A0AAN4UP86_9RHOB|nr:crotonase/enoyl-CoA hydratase family protein [Allgaiera indica]KDB03994.1 enoyl-CoA hydratase [Defluviimonas sp. 20V17]GHD99370.1 enoyl-CoA hydratase [Allgaiera indica]SDW27910.1 Enoyl-CoA hydratase/carnithine racemase [Allgaiera indica]